jgi:hypothetical protein
MMVISYTLQSLYYQQGEFQHYDWISQHKKSKPTCIMQENVSKGCGRQSCSNSASDMRGMSFEPAVHVGRIWKYTRTLN